jgi:thioredoxin reductase (NADPH)
MDLAPLSPRVSPFREVHAKMRGESAGVQRMAEFIEPLIEPKEAKRMAEHAGDGTVEHVVIVGSGMAGLTAAIYTGRALLNPLVIEGSEPGGQLTLTSDIENYPGFPDAIGGMDLMDAIHRQAERFGARFVMADVTDSDLSQRPFRLTLSDGQEILTETLIVASGARARTLGLESESRLMGRGVSTCATCDGAFFKNQVVAVVGGGDSAMEEATFLTRYAKEVYIIHRRDALRASPIMAERARSKPNIHFIWNTVVTEVLSDKHRVTGLRLKDAQTGEEREMAVNGLFLAIGHIPNTEWLKGQLPTDRDGYIITEPGTSETKIPGVFVAGDVADRLYQQAVTAAGSGCMAALDAQEFLEEHQMSEAASRPR